MIYLLICFISILVGSGIGIFLTTYYYPKIPSLMILKNFIPITLVLASTSAILILIRSKKLFIITLSILITFVSFSYSTIKSKERIDKLLKVKSQNFVKGIINISFLNKIFVNTGENTILVYVKKFDREFAPIGAEVIISGKSKHIYHYLTNKNTYGYFLYLFKNNVPYIVYSQEDSIAETKLPNSTFFKAINIIKQDVYKTFSEKISNTYFLSASLILGESSEMSKEFTENIRITGISHIFSVSGFHVGVIVVAFVLLLNILRIPKLFQFIIISVFLTGYSLIVGLKPPVVRASILASIILLVRAINLSPNYLNITLIVGIVMLIINPFLSVDVGFILSFFAVISIILFSKYIDEFIVSLINRYGKEPNRFLKNIITLFSVSLTAVMFTFPVVIIWFGGASLTGILSSIILVPLSSINIVSGIIAYVSNLIIPPIGSIMFRGVNFLNLLFMIITQLFSKLGLIINLRIDVITSIVFITLYYIILVVMFILISNRRLINEKNTT